MIHTGVEFVEMAGVIMMPQLFANSLVTDQRVSALIVCFKIFFTILICHNEGAIPTLWTIRSSVPIFLDNVDCHSSEATLLNCSHFRRDDRRYKCHYGGYAGVKCSEEHLRAQNVSAATVNTTTHTVMISWELYSGAPHKPSSFRVECFINQLHKEFNLWVNNGTLTQISVGDLLSSTFFACCVSAIYYGYYETRRRCTLTDSMLHQIYSPLPLQIKH